MINRIPELWEDRMLSMMVVNDKLSLGGSLVLHMLGIMDIDFKDRVPDFDFSLTESLTEDEYSKFRDFFQLSLRRTGDEYGMSENEINSSYVKEILQKDLILLESVPRVDINNTIWNDHYYKVDFFNRNHLKKKDWFKLDYFGTPIKCTHPSIILAAKMMYGTDIRIGKQHKHFQDIQKIDWTNYFKIIRNIRSKMKVITSNDGFQENKEQVFDKWYFDINNIVNKTTIGNDLPF